MAQRRGALGVRGAGQLRGPTSAGPLARPTAEPPAESLPIDEIAARYPDEWIVVEVAELDESHRIVRGRVLAHGTSARKVMKAHIQAHRDNPGIHTYLFVGGSPPATIEEWRERLAQAPGAI
jgi:hypothetical protein